MLDPLRAEDVDPAQRIDDGLPQTLEEDVRRYGLRAFKVKIGGDPQADARRLDELAEFLPTVAGDDWLVTLDAKLVCRYVADVGDARLDGIHLLLVDIEARDLKAGLGELQAQGQAHVAEAYDSDLRGPIIDLLAELQNVAHLSKAPS